MCRDHGRPATGSAVPRVRARRPGSGAAAHLPTVGAEPGRRLGSAVLPSAADRVDPSRSSPSIWRKRICRYAGAGPPRRHRLRERSDRPAPGAERRGLRNRQRPPGEPRRCRRRHLQRAARGPDDGDQHPTRVRRRPPDRQRDPEPDQADGHGGQAPRGPVHPQLGRAVPRVHLDPGVGHRLDGHRQPRDAARG